MPWGLVLSLIGIVAIAWQGATGQLNLYIHPRYNTFTLVMIGLGLVGTAIAWTLRSRGAGGAGRWGAGTAAAAMVLALLVVPPATLSASSAQQRSTNTTDSGDVERLAGADASTFTLRDWSVLVTDPESATTHAGQSVKLVGFVAPVDGQHPDTFHLARFVITCCTVDARPVVVPVALQGWAGKHKPDQWLEVSGRFMPAEQAPGGAVLVLQPTELKPIPRPSQPYEY